MSSDDGSSKHGDGNDHKDVAGTLFHPTQNIGEMAVLNPSIPEITIVEGKNPWPVRILHRTRRTNSLGEEYSTLDIRNLNSPIHADATGRVLIIPGESYDLRGCEDGKFIVNDGVNQVIYIGVDDVGNTVPCLAEVGKGLDTVKKLGPIMYPITLEDAIKNVNHPAYKELWGKQLESRKRWNDEHGIKGDILLNHKDSVLHREKDGWAFLTRMEPNIQVFFAKNLRDFKEKEYMIDQLKNLEDRTVMWTEPTGWASEKIGLGSPIMNIRGRKIALYHGVEKEGNNFIYRGGFVEFDDKYRAIARLKDPLLTPAARDVLYEPGVTKSINFPTAMLLDPENGETLWIYMGLGDERIGYRSTSSTWVLESLRRPENRIIRIAA